MDKWQLIVLADIQRERYAALLREQEIIRLLRDQDAGKHKPQPAFKRALVVAAVGAVLAALWLAQLS